MIRPWGVQSLTGSAQPWFGDVLTAAFAPVGDAGPQKVTVASTTFYRVGDRIILGIGQAGANVLMVDRVFSATVLYCRSEGGAALKAWNNSTIIALAINVSLITFQGVDGNAAAIWLGSDNTVTVAGGSAFRQIQKVAAGVIPDWWEYRTATSGQNSLNTDLGWMIGTAADKILIAGHQN
jgi:hypothetical protein